MVLFKDPDVVHVLIFHNIYVRLRQGVRVCTYWLIVRVIAKKKATLVRIDIIYFRTYFSQQRLPNKEPEKEPRTVQTKAFG